MAQRRLVAAEIKRAKNVWFEVKANEVEHGMVTGVAGKGVWQRLREIQKGGRGLQPVRPKIIRNKDGEVCVGPSETLQRWHVYFEAVLNIRSEFNEGIAQALPQHPIRDELS